MIFLADFSQLFEQAEKRELFAFIQVLENAAPLQLLQTQEMLQDKLAQTQETLQSKISQLETQITGAKNYSLNHRFHTAIKAVFGKPLL